MGLDATDSSLTTDTSLPTDTPPMARPLFWALLVAAICVSAYLAAL